jgi:serine/threonine protein kinase/tetratricopeptide (TPR) repeat protein
VEFALNFRAVVAAGAMLMSDPSNQAKAIFLAAIEDHAPEQWPTFLKQACAGDEQLRGEVEKLLHARARMGSFHETPGSPLPPTVDEPRREAPGLVIGRYKLVQKLGEGGMGTVWMAQQTEPVKRLVALKLIKPGMDSGQIIARFEAERQALALMDHPNIARVLDAGTTTTGLPYFVMELVKGVPLTRYCDEQRLTPKQRLELFIPVCQAIQHAHQKGIIHRDIKPSNVLVAPFDGKPVPKVIDFGVAKAAGLPLTERTLVTGLGTIVGTLEYMSPEQAELNQLDVDTRSDIYSLGVLLYELLTGSTPLERKRLKVVAALEVLRLIREEEPPKPSTRLSESRDSLASISAQRRMEPAKLTKLVRGELDWIVMKALEKDRNRRYETGNGFAEDVQRYLTDQPVHACPPSALYRFRKFTRRNKARLAVVAGLLLIAAVIAGSLIHQALDSAARTAEQALAKAARQTETTRLVTAALAQASTLVAEGDKQISEPVRWAATVAQAVLAVERAEALAEAGDATDELMVRVREVREAVNAARLESRVSVELKHLHSESALARLSLSSPTNLMNVQRMSSRYAEAMRDYGLDLADLGKQWPQGPSEVQRAQWVERVRSSRLRNQLVDALEEWESLGATERATGWIRYCLKAVEPASADFQYRWRGARSGRDRAALLQMIHEPEIAKLQPAVVERMVVNIGATEKGRIGVEDVEEQLLRMVQERHPCELGLNFHLGINLLCRKPPRAAEAVEYLRAALALTTADDQVRCRAYHALAAALYLKGDREEGLRAFQAAVRIEPGLAHMGGWSLFGTLFDLQDQDGLCRLWQAAVQVHPRNASFQYSLGWALGKNGDPKGSIQAYRKAIEFDREDLRTHLALGYVLYQNGEVEEAIRVYHVSAEGVRGPGAWQRSRWEAPGVAPGAGRTARGRCRAAVDRGILPERQLPAQQERSLERQGPRPAAPRGAVRDRDGHLGRRHGSGAAAQARDG